MQSLRSHYQPNEFIDNNPQLTEVMELLKSGHFNQLEPGIFDNIINSLLATNDPWLTLADFTSFVAAQEQVSQTWKDTEKWTRMSIMNTACSGFFSTDRTMQQYNDELWKLKPM